VKSLLVGLLSALVAAHQAVAAGNLVARTTGVAVASPNADDPVEKEFRKLMADDDAAAAEVDGWIQENRKFAGKGAGIPDSELNRRIRARFEAIRQAYEDFIKRHPDHARARIALASLLDDMNDEHGEISQLERARELDPKNPAVWNQLANYYGCSGDAKKAFAHYARAIELDPKEPIYYENFGTTVYLFRKDAMEYYHINEQQTFDKALELYRQATKLDPTNFVLATDVAKTYYGIRPVRTDEALNAWTNALKLAHNEIEREGVYIHIARFLSNAGRFDEARAQLNAVTNDLYTSSTGLKERVLQSLVEREKEAGRTNRPPVAPAQP
jgi:tetratricopeptide (TPR) repeat protein